ncbi:MAG: hypothetical protein EHM72_05040 [Calditrichaeota bacterium]|nr:MAG: hypothetical protein EHM72_05040 [Calditrichota bacterium]
MTKQCCRLFLLLFFNLSALYGQFSIVSTEHMNLLYLGRPHEYIVPHLARCFTNSLEFEGQLFNYRPSEKTTVYLQDFSDYGNAGATAVPMNFIRMDLAPSDYVYETIPANERMNWVMNHEMVHIITSDQKTAGDHFYRSAFLGKVQDSAEDPISLFYAYLTNPRRLTPRWYTEGIAVFMETWLAGGLGRAQGAYDEMVFRSMVRDQTRFYNVVGLESEGTAIDFQVGANSYLYGTRFVSYLSYQYGPKKLLQWYMREPGSKRYFATQFKHVYGSELSTEWARWVEWEHRWQQANLDSIRRHPTTRYRPISDRALGSVSRGYYNAADHKLYTAVLYPGQVAHIASIDLTNGKLEKICEVKGPMLYTVTSLAYDPSSHMLFFTSDNSRWRDLNVVDINTGQSRRLIKDARIGDLAFNNADSSLWGVRHFNGISTLVRIPFPYREWNQIRSFPYGRDIFDIDISPDGALLTASMVEISGHQKLIKMVTAQADTFQLLFDFENSLPQSFVFSPDGKYLYGSSYYSGVSNIYRYNWDKQDMEVLSNTESGFFRPVPISDDSLLVMRYTGQGFVPSMIACQVPDRVSAITFLGTEISKKHPLVREWVLGSPARINVDSLTLSSKPYHSLHHLKLTSAYPIIQGYKNDAAIGYRTNFSDLIGAAGMQLSALYTPNPNIPENERFHLGLDVHYWQWRFRAGLNTTDFYDLFGPTKISRKGYSLQLEHNKSLIYDKPKTMDLNLSIKHYGGLETLPDYQNISAPYSRLNSMKLALDYQFIRKSLGAVDDEKGLRWRTIFSGVHVNREIFPRMYAHFDYGIPLAIDHSSIWVRSSAGYSFGDQNNAFANFFFGGFGNNWIDCASEKRYRDYFTFPGVPLNHFGGVNYGKVMVEWNLPPLRFRRLGFTSFYTRWMRTAVFASAMQTNFDAPKGSEPWPTFGVQRTLANIGLQADFRLVTLSRFDSTFSLGYAVAMEGDAFSKEFMISLKIL